MADIRRKEPASRKVEEGRFSRWWTGSKRWTKYWYLRLMRQKSSPRNLAAACALGMFIGSMPIIPFQSVVVIALAFVMRVNKLAAWLATCYSNAATMVPFYYFLFLVGKTFMPFEDVSFDPNNLEMTQLIESGWQVFAVMFTGGFIFGVPATIVTYFATLFIVRRYRERRTIKMLRKRTSG